MMDLRGVVGGGFVKELSREGQVGGSDVQELRSARSPSSRPLSFLAGPKPSQQKARLSISLWHGVRAVCGLRLCFAFETKGWMGARYRSSRPPPQRAASEPLEDDLSSQLPKRCGPLYLRKRMVPV